MLQVETTHGDLDSSFSQWGQAGTKRLSRSDSLINLAILKRLVHQSG